MINVSTREPEGKWKAWTKWLRLFGVLAAGFWLARLLDLYTDPSRRVWNESR